MLFVLSPAKTLDFTPAPAGTPATRPVFAKETGELVALARTLDSADLKRLMHVSDALADLNVARFQAFRSRAGARDVQAVLAFAGDVYTGLRARDFDPTSLLWAQDRLRILSGLYGVLAPLDRIQPYRLEMGARLATGRGETLYEFWGDRIARALNRAARGHADPTVVNLASQEYFAGVDQPALKLPLVACLFKQDGEAGPRTVALYAKIARGMMARYAIENRIERAADLKGFAAAGYRHRPDLSSDTQWVFTRTGVA